MKSYKTLIILFLIFIYTCVLQNPNSVNEINDDGQVVCDTVSTICETDTLVVSLENSMLFKDSILFSKDTSKLDSVTLHIKYTTNSMADSLRKTIRNDTIYISPSGSDTYSINVLSFYRSPCVAIQIIQNGQVLSSVPRQWYSFSNETRLIAMKLRNMTDTSICETAPGDSVELSCYFGGKPTSFVKFSSTNKIKWLANGADSVWDVLPLEYVIVKPLEQQNRFTQHISIKFKIPEDIIKTSPAINEDALTQMGISKEFLFSSLEHLINLSPGDWEADSLVKEMNKSKLGPIIMQTLSVPLRIFVLNDDGNTVQYNHFVRPNRFFSDLPKKINDVFVNRNPSIKSLLITKTGNQTTVDIQDIDSLNVESGQLCTLNVVIDSSLIDRIQPETGSVSQYEQHSIAYFYKYDSNETHCVPKNELGLLSTNNFITANFKVPDCEKVKTVHIWITLYDFGLPEVNRPGGKAIYEVDLKLKYN